MDIFPFFENIRRANRDMHIGNPADQLSDQQIQQLLNDAGSSLTVAAFREQAHKPSENLICPLCGRPSTHLTLCRNCSWDGEWEMAYGAEARGRLRNLFQNISGFAPSRVTNAANHAYQHGGCMVCARCWEHVLSSTNAPRCPLRLLADHAVAGRPFPYLFHVFLDLLDITKIQTALLEELDRLIALWTDVWNTAPEEERQAVGEWRMALITLAVESLAQIGADTRRRSPLRSGHFVWAAPRVTPLYVWRNRVSVRKIG